MNILVDYHHGGLFKSLKLLFEDRLGHTLYRPIGMEWYFNGFWNIADPYPNPIDTATQYLEINNYGFDQYKFLNGTHYLKDGIYYVWDAAEEIHHKGLTFDKFLEMDIDVIISSFAPHDATYARLISQYKPKAKHVAQMGNIYQTTEVNNVLCSTLPYPTPEGKNVVFYHQEFDLSIFKAEFKKPQKIISSFVNCLPRPDLFGQYSAALPDFCFKSFGAGCMDGTLTGNQAIANEMNNSMFGWHIKPGGDGFGHVIHNWYACGKPIITNFSDYQDKLAGKLLTHGITAIDLEAGTFEENIERIKYFSQPENYQWLNINAYSRFKEIVNLDKEAEDIKRFLDNLI